MNGNKKTPVKNEMRQLPPLENKGLVGGSGGLAFIGGIAGGVAKGAFNLVKNVLSRSSKVKTATTGSIKNPVGMNVKTYLESHGKLISSSKRQAFTPAEREGAMNLLKKL